MFSKNKKIFILSLIFLVTIVYLCISFGYTWDGPKGTAAYYPNPSREDIEIRDLKNIILHSGNTVELIAYKAVRERDIGICDGSDNPGECREKANIIMDIRNLAEEDCNQLTDRFLKNVCVALKNNNCASLGGNERKLCEAILNRDAKSALAASSAIHPRAGTSLQDEEEVINIYHGYKNYSEIACDRFSPSASLTVKLSCKILFSPYDVDDIIDQILTDLAYFTYVKEKGGSRNLCNKIKNRDIKRACFGSTYRNLNELLK